MRTREDIEQLELSMLAPYAMRSRFSLGRAHDEPQHEVRTCYQRDRDRIVHSESFRKLEYKTQVFSIFTGDYYRTRLTHTIEVAQIARTIGRCLRLNEDLIEAIALAHDLGHPPFGHAGEEALKGIMKEHGGFDHNRRSFEIVSKFEKRYPQFDGLNLSREVLVGILKHETVYDRQGYSLKFKEGPTLEAKIVDFADSVAYLSHDIDDGLTSGLISEQDLMASHLWRTAYEETKDILKDDSLEMKKYQVVKRLIDMQIRDFLIATDGRLKKNKFQNVQQIKECKSIIAGFSSSMKRDVAFLQKLIHRKLYEHYRVIRMTEKAGRIINELFYTYLKQPMQLPYSVYPRDKKLSKKKKFEIICNYIASMTDRYAMEEHKKLFNPYAKV